MLAELTVRVVFQYEDDASLERHTAEGEDLMRRALAGHAAMYDLEVAERRVGTDDFPAKGSA